MVKTYIINNKKLMKEWNYKKNAELNLKPEYLTVGSSKKVWWKCSNCENEWLATPKNRLKGTGCPCCSLKKIGKNRVQALINKKGSLFDNRPDLVEEWDIKKNENLTPKDVTCGSGLYVWWKCKKGHSWKARINHRVNGSDCIYCTKQKTIVGVNDLATTYPELIKEWDYEKNKDLLPENFMPKSNKKVWWKCELGHSWQATISHRVEGTRCPQCFSDYGTSFPEQAICYYLSKVTIVENRKKLFDQEIDIFLPNYNIGFEYDGSFYHSSEDSKIKELKKDSILLKNGVSLYRIKESNKNKFDLKNKVIYCIIDKNYHYIENILNTIQDILKINIGKVDISKDNLDIYNKYISSIKKHSIAVENKDLAEEWDYDKNNGLIPENFTKGSNLKVWWKCPKCHSSYSATIFHRVNGTSCPFCNGKQINDKNNLKATHPDLIKQWDYEKNNGLIPENFKSGSHKKVWWICVECKKSFESVIYSRTKAKYCICSNCMHKKIGESNKLIAYQKKSKLK